MTHDQLVDVAVRWLKRTRRCGVVLREHRFLSNEFPDAIGWGNGCYSTMVECKVSRSDFLADRKKPGRVRGLRLAWRCYYLVPKGLIAAHDVPEAWGLLEVDANGRVTVAKAVPLNSDDREAESMRNEIRLLYSELRRYQAQGIKYRKLGLNGGYADGGQLGSLADLLAEREKGQIDG